MFVFVRAGDVNGLSLIKRKMCHRISNSVIFAKLVYSFGQLDICGVGVSNRADVGQRCVAPACWSVPLMVGMVERSTVMLGCGAARFSSAYDRDVG